MSTQMSTFQFWKGNSTGLSIDKINSNLFNSRLSAINSICKSHIATALDNIIYQLINGCGWRSLEDINTSSIYDFKISFGYGSWNELTNNEFIDLFAFTYYEFHFSLFQCKLLYEYFNVIISPSSSPS